MPRFFVPLQDIQGDTAYIRGDDARHIAVLRIGPEEDVVVCNGQGTDYICRMSGQENGAAVLRVRGARPSAGEPGISCMVYAGFPKGDKAESIVQKSVELGAAGICFFSSSRCVSRPDEKSLRKKLERLNRVALEAAKQCGRGRIPEVTAASYEQALDRAAAAQLPLFFWEDVREQSMRTILAENAGAESAAIVTGPEGGFSAQEAALAAEKGLRCVGLGSRILRCETAPLCALSALMYASGNL